MGYLKQNYAFPRRVVMRIYVYNLIETPQPHPHDSRF